MEKKYILEGLDCPNCALKIEKALNKQSCIEEANVNAATLICTILYKGYTEEIEKQIIHLIEDLEDIHVKSKNIHVDHERKHEEHCECAHHHHHEDCCSDHEHHHKHGEHCECEHHHEENECCCGHEHYHEPHEECGCHEHGHHHKHDEDCCCKHDHEHTERKVPEGKSTIKIKWTIEGLDCAHCALKVEEAVNEVEGIECATLNFTTKTLIMYINKKVDLKHVQDEVKETIYNLENVRIFEENEKSYSKKDYKKYAIGLGVMFLVFGLFLEENYLIIEAYFMIGFSVILKAFKNIKRKEIFDENFLMTIATLGALFVGEYLEAVAVMLFYQIGEYFQNKAVDQSRKSIADLMNIKADVAHLQVNDQLIDVDPETIHVHDIIVIQPGERVPLDGIVVKGTSTLDTSALTGESLPREIRENDEILGGCINLNGILQVEVTRLASESTVNRILDMVENASSKKAKTEQKMTRFAKIYTPIVVVFALLLAIVPNFFNTGVGWQEWLIRACTFLVISCPCAIVLSIPLGYFAGIGAASKKGILVKGGNYLEILSELDCIVFDKTGTLTNGTFKVTDIQSSNKEECLRIAATAESYSTHPIALSIRNEYNKEIDKNDISELEEIAGYGIKAKINGKVALVGNKKLLDKYGINSTISKSYGTLVYVAYNGEFMGVIEINDTLKDTTKTSLKEIKAKGVKKLVMLTGDRKESALKIASDCGIDEVHYELLPTDKVNKLEEILAKTNKKVAYVGDGINDAPVLARSDLGIAMGGLGSEAAVEASDLVLMKDDLSALANGIDLARFVQKIMNQNIVFILAVKGFILLLSLFGYANMWLGVFADVGVSVLAVINSMRILNK